MSRARASAQVHVVADNIGQAVEDLSWDCSRERRQVWAIDTGTPEAPRAQLPLEVEADMQVPAALRTVLGRARLKAECATLASLVPNALGPDVQGRIVHLDTYIRILDQELGSSNGRLPARQDAAAVRPSALEHNVGPDI